MTKDKTFRENTLRRRSYRNPVKASPWITALMMAPFTTVFLLFVVIPVLAAVVISFTNFNMVQIPQWVGFQNYMYMLFSDEIFITALKNTIIFALITGPVGYVLSFAVA